MPRITKQALLSSDEVHLVSVIKQKIKTTIFNLLSIVLENNMVNKRMYILLVLLEGLQLFYYTIHPDIQNTWSSSFSDGVRGIIKYFQFTFVLEARTVTGQKTVYLSTFIGQFVINFLVLIAFFLLAIIYHRKLHIKYLSVKYLALTLVKLVSVFGVLVNTIYTIPTIQINVFYLLCQSSNPVYEKFGYAQSTQIALVVLAVLGLANILAQNFIFNNLLIDINPFSTLPFAQTISKVPFAGAKLALDPAAFSTAVWLLCSCADGPFGCRAPGRLALLLSICSAARRPGPRPPPAEQLSRRPLNNCLGVR